MSARIELRTKAARPSGSGSSARFIQRFAEIGTEDIALVEGKNASLGGMRRALTGKGVPVPDGALKIGAAIQS